MFILSLTWSGAGTRLKKTARSTLTKGTKSRICQTFCGTGGAATRLQRNSILASRLKPFSRSSSLTTASDSRLRSCVGAAASLRIGFCVISASEQVRSP